MSIALLSSLFAGLLAGALPASSPPDAGSEHVRASLVAEQSALVPGTSAWLGLRLEHDPHWHSYWINPGDSGLPTRLAWQLPDGYAAGEIAWPVPRRFVVGELNNFGYDGDLLLPVRIEVPASAQPGSSAHLEVQAKWLVCQEECIPGKATLALDVPVRDVASADPRHAGAFAAARAAQPRAEDASASARLAGDRIEVVVHGAGLEAAGIDAFAVTTRVVGNAPPHVEPRPGGVALSFAKSDYFTSMPTALDLVVLRPPGDALKVRAAFGAP